MLVQMLSSGILIHCSKEELHRAGLSEDELDQKAALRLVKKALAPEKQSIPSYPELQIFFSKEELLIFVRPFLPGRGHFSQNFCIS